MQLSKGGKKSAGVSSLRDCAHCGATEEEEVVTHRACSKCKVTFYCSKECQAAHWKTGGHKQRCAAPGDRKAPPPEAARSATQTLSDQTGLAGGTCVICLELLSAGGATQELPCHHSYHAACVAQLRAFGVQQHQACPTCRAALPPLSPDAAPEEQLYLDGMTKVARTYLRHGSGAWPRLRGRDQETTQEGVGLLREASRLGHAKAQVVLGELYHAGHGVTTDHAAAVKWWGKAAAAGLSSAQGDLGAMYREGKGVTRSYVTALVWFHKAAAQGEKDPMFNIGCMHRDGEGVPQDISVALEWWRKAADLGCMKAQNSLGVCYFTGDGVPVDFAVALRWFRLSAAQGHPTAQNNIGIVTSAM